MIKSILIITAAMVIALSGAAAEAQTFYTANQATVAWDAVAKIAPTDVIKYQVFTRADLVATGTKVGAEITATQLLISFPAEGQYFVGVQALRYPQGVTTAITSTIAWSTDAAACQNGATFGFVYYIAPSMVGGIRRMP